MKIRFFVPSLNTIGKIRGLDVMKDESDCMNIPEEHLLLSMIELESDEHI